MSAAPALRLVGSSDPPQGPPTPRRRWHNPLPAWITDHPSHAALPASARLVLQAIADTCDAPARPGASLIGARGGARLEHLAGVSRRTCHRAITRLVRLGFVALVERATNQPGFLPTPNTYGVPARPGALDAKDHGRRGQMMVRGADGVYRPHHLPESVERPTNAVNNLAQAKDDDPNQLQLWQGGASVRMALPPCQFGTQPSLSIGKKTRGDTPASDQSSRRVWTTPAAGVSRRGVGEREPDARQIVNRDVAGIREVDNRPIDDSGRAGRGQPPPTMRNIRPEDLRDTRRLLELHADAVRLGYLLAGNQRDRLNFAAAAEHALRIADRPVALFASMVRRRRWLFITEADEAAAWQRLKRHDLAEWEAGTPPALRPQAPPRPARAPFSALSADARALAAVEAATKLHHLGLGELSLLRRSTGQPWTTYRLDEAARELRAWRATA